MHPLKQRIIDKGIRFAHIARKLNLSKQALFLWFAGERRLSDYRIMQICSVIEIDPTPYLQDPSVLNFVRK